jgi:hypothetical protein
MYDTTTIEELNIELISVVGNQFIRFQRYLHKVPAQLGVIAIVPLKVLDLLGAFPLVAYTNNSPFLDDVIMRNG